MPANARGNGATMKSIFIDCNNQLAPVFAPRADARRPAIASIAMRFNPRPARGCLAGYDVCLDDNSYMRPRVMAQGRGIKNIVCWATGRHRAIFLESRRERDPQASRCTPSRATGHCGSPSTRGAAVIYSTAAVLIARWTGRCEGRVGTRLESRQINGKRRSPSRAQRGHPGEEVARIRPRRQAWSDRLNRSAAPRSACPLVGLD